MKKLLLTGASGFIGKQLISHLKNSTEYKDYQIVTLGSSAIEGFDFIDHRNYKFNSDDFLTAGIDRIDVIFHFGAFTPKNSVEASNVESCCSNILNTMNLIRNLPSPPVKFIFASTLDVYGKVSTVIDEATLTLPTTLYGQSKLFCEKMLESWAISSTCVLQILRIGHIYGPGEDAYQKIIPLTIKSIINDVPPTIWSDGSEKRSYLYIEDACRLIIKASLLMEYIGPINLSSSTAKSIREIVDIIIDVSRKNISANILNNVASAATDFTFDTRKMISYLGEESFSINEGLRHEYNYFMAKQ